MLGQGNKLEKKYIYMCN